jgi:hypothetical protein
LSKAVIALTLLILTTATAGAQTLIVSGAVQRDRQQFREAEVPTRLDGWSTGWVVGAAAPLPRHLLLAIEWSDAGTIEDVRTTTLDINTRPVAITSTFRHHTMTVSALGGYSHVLSRVRLAYLAGVAFTGVERAFASNATSLVLVSPSDLPVSAGSARTDRSQEITGGINAFVRISQRLHAVAGLRAQRITLPFDISGWSLRTFIGAGWGL